MTNKGAIVVAPAFSLLALVLLSPAMWTDESSLRKARGSELSGGPWLMGYLSRPILMVWAFGHHGGLRIGGRRQGEVTWEYKVVVLDWDGGGGGPTARAAASAERELNLHGAEGWELVSTHQVVTNVTGRLAQLAFHFKRPVTEKGGGK